MSKILLAWELGDGLGHVTRLLKIAEELRSRGHDCIIVARDIENAGRLAQKAGFDTIAAPAANVYLAAANGRDPTSASDILAFIGFTEPHRLAPMVKAWDALVRRLDPDLVILDYAPTVRLAIGPSRPVVVIGDGFTTPPGIDGKCPKFRSSPQIIAEDQILATVQAVQAEYGGWCPQTLPELFEGDRTFIITLPQLDCFGRIRPVPAVGPLASLPKPVEDTPTADYFAYLSVTAKGIDKFLKALSVSGLKGSLFLRGSTQKQRQQLTTENLTVHEGPQDMAQMAAMSRLLIHHGGVGTCETLLGLGRPQLILPRHVEQRLNARVLVQDRIAKSLNNIVELEIDAIVAEIQAAVNDATLATRARKVANQLAARPHASLDRIVSNCIELLS